MTVWKLFDNSQNQISDFLELIYSHLISKSEKKQQILSMIVWFELAGTMVSCPLELHEFVFFFLFWSLKKWR